MSHWLNRRQTFCVSLQKLQGQAERCHSVLNRLEGVLKSTNAHAANGNLPTPEAVEAAAKEWKTIIAAITKLISRFGRKDDRGNPLGARVGVVGLEKAGKSTFLSVWASGRMDLLPADARRCTGTTTRIFNTPQAEAGIFSAKVRFLTRAQFLTLIQSLCEMAGCQPISNLAELEQIVVPQPGAAVEANDPSSNVRKARQELISLQSIWPTDIRPQLSDVATTLSVGPLAAEPFSKAIKKYIDLTDSALSRAVEAVDLYANLEGFPASGVELVDLPGIDSPSKSMNDATLASLKDIDLLMFLHDIYRPNLNGPEHLLIEQHLTSLRVVDEVSSSGETMRSKQAINRFQVVFTRADGSNFQLAPVSFSELRKDDIDVPTSNIHVVSSAWRAHSDMAQREFEQDARMARILTELQSLGVRAVDDPDLSGFNRFTARIQTWLSQDLVRFDEEDMLQCNKLFEHALMKSRELISRCRLARSREAKPIDLILPRLLFGDKMSSNPDAKQGLMSQIQLAFATPFVLSSGKPPEKLNVAMLDKDRLAQPPSAKPAQKDQAADAPAASANGAPAAAPADASSSAAPQLDVLPVWSVKNADYLTIRTHMYRIRQQIKSFLTVNKAMHTLRLMDVDAHASPFSVREFEAAVRLSAQSGTLTVLNALTTTMNTSVDETLQFYVDRFLDATHEGGSLRLIHQNCPHLQDVLEQAVGNVKGVLADKWAKIFNDTISNITGVPDRSAALEDIKAAYAHPNCVHQTSSFLDSIFSPAAEVEHLFKLPWNDRRLLQWQGVWWNRPGSCPVAQDGPMICAIVVERVHKAVDHLCEMMEHRLIRDNALYDNRAQARNGLADQLTRVHYNSLLSIVFHYKADIWKKQYTTAPTHQQLEEALQTADATFTDCMPTQA